MAWGQTRFTLIIIIIIIIIIWDFFHARPLYRVHIEHNCCDANWSLSIDGVSLCVCVCGQVRPRRVEPNPTALDVISDLIHFNIYMQEWKCMNVCNVCNNHLIQQTIEKECSSFWGMNIYIHIHTHTHTRARESNRSMVIHLKENTKKTNGIKKNLLFIHRILKKIIL